jgi:tetratricopeptide (TPR) repeat protein
VADHSKPKGGQATVRANGLSFQALSPGEITRDHLQNRGLNDLITEMQTTGATESSGVFTISTDKAREKLSQFALPNPRLYVLNVLASAVLGGATRIEANISTRQTSIEYDGEPLNPSQLEGLWNQLLNPAKPALHELAVAINAARTLQPAELSVESWSGDRGCRCDIEGDSLRLTDLEPKERTGSGTRITVRETALKKTVLSLFGVPERAILRANTYLGPAKVVLDGRELNQTLKIGHSPQGAAWLHLKSGHGGLQVQAPDPSWAPACMIGEAFFSEGGFEAVLTLGPEDVCKKESLLLICSGVAFRRPAELLGCSFASGVVSTDLLRKNLSHTDLAEDDAYRELLERLRERVDLLIVQRMEHPQSLPGELTGVFRKFADELKARLAARGLQEEREVVTRWIKEASLLEDILNPELWQSMTSELVSLGYSASGQALETRLRRTLREAGQAQFQSGQSHLAVRHWERIVELGQLRAAAWLEEEAEILVVLRGLCGMAVEPTLCSTPGRRAAMLRRLGRPADALEHSPCQQTRAETYLALGHFEEAEALLREILSQGPSVQAAEALSDLLAFGPCRTSARRKEGLLWKERAQGMRADQHPAFGQFLLEDLALLARSTMPFYTWLHYRVRASAAQVHSTLAEVDKALAEGRELLRRKNLGALRVKSALASAESKFTASHPFLELARARGAHILREAGEWREADDLLARGHLIESLTASWDAATSLTPPENKKEPDGSGSS